MEPRSKVKKPKEGEWFKVEAAKIDRNLFAEKRDDCKQEWLRKFILCAFEELDLAPERYASFEIMFPKKTWRCLIVKRLKMISRVYGDGMTNWVEQALEWAQRIENESWEAVCNEPDMEECYKIIIWSENETKLVGSCCSKGDESPAATIHKRNLRDENKTTAVVPSVVRRKRTC